MIVVLVLLSAGLGAADQYLGSSPGHLWAVDVSLLAAPWLLLPFLIGSTQPSARRAITLATIGTCAALLGYIGMTLSPVEDAKVSVVGVLGLLRWQVRWFLLASITSPLFGWLGHRWRSGTNPWPPIIAAAALCLEPLLRSQPILRTAVGQPIHSPVVKWLEIGAGAGLCVLTVIGRYRARLAKDVRGPVK